MSLLNPKTVSRLLSTHAETLEADSLHLEQKPRIRSAQPINGLFVAVFTIQQYNNFIKEGSAITYNSFLTYGPQKNR